MSRERIQVAWLGLLAWGLLLGVGCSSPAGVAAPPPIAVDRARGTLQFTDEPLESLVRLLSDYTGKSIECALPDDADPVRLSVDLVDVPWDHAVEVLAAAADLRAVWQTDPTGEGRIVLGRGLPGRPFQALVAAPPTDNAKTRAPAGLPNPDLPIDINVEDMDLGEVMEQIGAEVGANILVDPNVSETVTVSLTQIPWYEAVQVISKMTRTEVEEREGVLLLEQTSCCAYIGFHSAEARTVARLLAAYTGRSLVLTPGALATKTSVELQGGLRGWLPALAHANGAEIFALHGVWIVAPRGSRPQLAEARVPFEVQPVPEPPAREGLRARARGAAAHDWIRAVAAYSGESTIVAQDIAGRIDRSWASLTPQRELWSLWTFEVQGETYMLQGGRGGRPSPSPKKPTRRSLTLPDGRKIVVELQGLILPSTDDERQKASTILSGCHYYEHDRLISEDGEQELPVEIVKILPDRLVFKIEGREDKRYVVPFDE